MSKIKKKIVKMFSIVLAMCIIAGGITIPAHADSQTVNIYLYEGESTQFTISTGIYDSYTGNPDSNVTTIELISHFQKGQKGNTVDYNGELIELDDCHFTFKKLSDGIYQIYAQNGDTTVYIGPGTSPNGLPHYPTTIAQRNNTVSKGYKNNTFYLLDDSSEPRYLHFNSTKMYFDRVLEDALPTVTSFQEDCSMEIYERDATVLAGNVPGYKRVTDISQLQDGKDYLIVALASNGIRYALYPSYDTTDEELSPFTYVAKILTGGTSVRVNGKTEGVTSFTVGDVTYQVHVLSKLSKSATIYTNGTGNNQYDLTSKQEGASNGTQPQSYTYTNVVGAVDEEGYDSTIATYSSSGVGKTPYISLGTTSDYNGTPTNTLDECLYTFTKNGSVYEITGKATQVVDGKEVETTVYFRPYQIPGVPNATEQTEATNVTIENSTQSNAVYFKGKNPNLDGKPAGYLYFHRNSNYYFDQVDSVDQAACSFLLFRPLKSNETVIDSDVIPGYKQLTGTGVENQIDSGSKYLIVAKAGDNYYVLNPSTVAETENDNLGRPRGKVSTRYNHVAKIVLMDKLDATFTAKKPGQTGLKVGTTTFQITVKSIVTLHPENGENNITKEYGLNDSLGLPTVQREGYNFLGWYTAKTGGEKISADAVFDSDMFDKLSSSDMKLYAQWEKITDPIPEEKVPTSYSIESNVSSGTLPSTQPTKISVAIGEEYTFEEPTRVGYTFAGWYTWQNKKLTDNKITSYDYLEHGSEIVALWNPIMYTVTWFDEDGTTVLEKDEKIFMVQCLLMMEPHLLKSKLSNMYIPSKVGIRQFKLSQAMLHM